MLKEAIKEAIEKGAYVAVFYNRQEGVFEACTVAENGRDIFAQYNDVHHFLDFTDRVILDENGREINSGGEGYEENMEGIVEFEMDEIDEEITKLFK